MISHSDWSASLEFPACHSHGRSGNTSQKVLVNEITNPGRFDRAPYTLPVDPFSHTETRFDDTSFQGA